METSSPWATLAPMPTLLRLALAALAVSLVACSSPPTTTDAGSDASSCEAACAPTGIAQQYWCTYSDGQKYMDACVAQCHGATKTSCPGADAGSDAGTNTDGGTDTCVAACPPTGIPPQYLCTYSDGHKYGDDCVASCYHATVVSCPGADAGGAPTACIAACPPTGIQAQYWCTYSDGQRYMDACVAACYGAGSPVCPGADAGTNVTACEAACPPTGIQQSYWCTYSDGQKYMDACRAGCHNASVVTCP